MKTPTPTKTASGWRIQLRLGGQSVIVKAADKRSRNAEKTACRGFRWAVFSDVLSGAAKPYEAQGLSANRGFYIPVGFAVSIRA